MGEHKELVLARLTNHAMYDEADPITQGLQSTGAPDTTRELLVSVWQRVRQNRRPAETLLLV